MPNYSTVNTHAHKAEQRLMTRQKNMSFSYREKYLNDATH